MTPAIIAVMPGLIAPTFPAACFVSTAALVVSMVVMPLLWTLKPAAPPQTGVCGLLFFPT